LVDHAIFRAVNKGAIGALKAVGPTNEALYSEQTSLTDYRGAESANGSETTE
jgi:hypothetical protein